MLPLISISMCSPLCLTTSQTIYYFVLIQFLDCVRLFVPPWTIAPKASLSFTNSQSLLKLMSIDLVMPSNHLILHHPLSSCLQPFPSSQSFLMSWLLASGGQSIEASDSASILQRLFRTDFL